MASKNITFVPAAGVPAGANFDIYSGTDFQADLVVYGANNKAFDLTGYTGAAAMAKSVAIGATFGATETFTVGFTSAYAGKVRLSLTDTQTSSLAEGRYVYDFTITSSGFTYPLIRGNINVLKTITS